MNYIKFYILKNKKWIIYNSILLIIILFAIIQMYGRINYLYNDDITFTSKTGGFSFRESIDDIETIESLGEIDHYGSFILSAYDQKFTNYEKMYKTIFNISVLFDEEDYVREGNIINNNETGKVVVPYEYYIRNELQLNDTIQINGINFRITGVSNSNYPMDFFISYKDFKNLGLPVDSSKIKSDENIKNDDITSFKKDVENITGKELDLSISGEKIEFKGRDYILLYIMFILSLINMRQLYMFSLSKKSDMIKIFRISGIKSKSLMYAELVSVFITFIISFLLSYILVKLFNNIINNIYNINVHYMTINSYIEIFIIFIVFYIIMMYLSIRKYIKRLTSNIIKEY